MKTRTTAMLVVFVMMLLGLLGSAAQVLGGPVIIGNQLIERANATDSVTVPGTLGPAFVVLPSAVLPEGTLLGFQTWNQENPGGSQSSSQGNVFHAYVLRPTGTQYLVVYDSGPVTVPEPSIPGGQVFAFSVPTAPAVAVQAGDVIGFYGQGIPFDAGAGVDILSYPASADPSFATNMAPAQGSFISLGLDPGFPLFSQDRTYSFAAYVTDEGPPIAPTELRAAVEPLPTGSQVKLDWSNTDTTAFVLLERAEGAGAFHELAHLSPTAATFTDTSVVPGPFSYRVKTLNAVGSSEYAGPASVTVPRAASGPVIIGNQLIERANATDSVTVPGTLGPAFVVLPSAVLPEGTLLGFQTWNQENPGGSQSSSQGNVFHAYVLRPTGTQYLVVYDSGPVTVPEPSIPGGQVFAFSVPTAPAVAVQAGDVIGFYGQGIPFDAGAGVDILSYPASADPSFATNMAPAQGSFISLGLDPGFPLFSQDRTYSFAAYVTDEGPPIAPTELRAAVEPLPTGSQVKLDWSNTDTTAFVLLERAEGAGAFHELAHLSPTAATFTDTSVVPGPFSYRVKTLNAVGSSEYAGPASVTVPRAASTTVVTSSLSPSSVGQNVTFTATVSPSTATGMVQFNVDGVAGAPVALLSGQATLSTSALVAGAHLVTVTYGGDAAHLPSTSATLIQTVGAALRATTIVVTSNRSPSATVGQRITFAAKVRPVTGPGTPTGTVQFTIDGVNAGGLRALNDGRATFSTEALSAGSHDVIATYNGSAVFSVATSPTIVQVVNPAGSSTVVWSSTTPASVFGQSVTFTARVRPETATGTIQFTVDGLPAGAPVALNGEGRAALVVTTLAVGMHTISAAYSGDLTYAASSSATIAQTVNKASSRTIVTTNGSPAMVGTAVVFTATVTAGWPGGGIPSSVVQFRIDGANVGAPIVLSAAGRATLATSALTVGTHTYSAVYGGDSNFKASTSVERTQRIR